MSSSKSHGKADSFDDFVKTITSHYEKLIHETTKAPQGAREAFQAFTSAINWKEHWIRSLLLFHILYFIFFVNTRKNIDIQTGQFLLTCLLVMFSERLNDFGHNNWKEFSKQNYFDKRGVFMGVLYSGPLLLTGFCQLINFLFLAGQALIVAKKLEIQKKGKTLGIAAVNSEESESTRADTADAAAHGKTHLTRCEPPHGAVDQSQGAKNKLTTSDQVPNNSASTLRRSKRSSGKE